MIRGALIVFLSLAAASCVNAPYRVEFGGVRTESDAPQEPGAAQVTEEQTRLTWKKLHEDLEQIYRSRGSVRGPVPATYYERCRRAVSDLKKFHEPLAADIDAAIDLYSDIEQDSGAPGSVLLRRLQRLELDLRGALKARNNQRETP